MHGAEVKESCPPLGDFLDVWPVMLEVVYHISVLGCVPRTVCSMPVGTLLLSPNSTKPEARVPVERDRIGFRCAMT